MEEIYESILVSMKKLIGGNVDIQDDSFTTDLVFHINSVISILNQMGVITTDFKITGNKETWHDYLGTNEQKYQMVKSYMYFKVKMMFDPPSGSIMQQVINDNIKELEFRLYSKANF